MYQVAIVEDEIDAKDSLESCIWRYADETGEGFQITWFSNAIEFEEARQKFDLVFMDIQLPGISGIEAAQLLRTYDDQTPLIFVTNLAQYAVKGYEVSALDFIVKPLSYFNFRLRMDKALRHMHRNAGRSLVVITRDGMRIVPLSDIVYVEVSNHELVYHLWGNDAPLAVYGSLRKVEGEVEGGPFVRISSSHLVNMNYIRAIRGPAITVEGEATLYLSRSRKKSALAAITRFIGGSL